MSKGQLTRAVERLEAIARLMGEPFELDLPDNPLLVSDITLVCSNLKEAHKRIGYREQTIKLLIAKLTKQNTAIEAMGGALHQAKPYVFTGITRGSGVFREAAEAAMDCIEAALKELKTDGGVGG